MSKPTLSLIESLLVNIQSYLGKRLDLFKLKLVDKVSSVVSSIISWMIILIAGIMFFIIFNIGIALLIGDLLGKMYLGFLILAGVYALLCIVLFLGRGAFFKSLLSGILIRKMFKHVSPKNK